MDYAYENLSPERFQELCQAILTREFPNVQCFPVGQPDGGRDAAQYLSSKKEDRSFLVFQVKYARRPLAEHDPHKWVAEAVAAEVSKINDLIPKGAQGYYLLTNVPGTSHLDAGSIDKVQTMLAEATSLPAQCWWRDDLNRRLDSAWHLKWAYPEIMSGPDLLRYLVEHGLGVDASRRTLAVRAFVSAQYERDQEVRFKQVELQNDLLRLFVDVPVEIRAAGASGYQLFLAQLAQRLGGPEESERYVGSEPSLGAAAMMLHSAVQQNIPQLVLEGAPGQGKSTLAQFVCQTHRMYLLGEAEVLRSLPEFLQPKSLRIPIKADLRDLATWLSKQDPFHAQDETAVPAQWEKSLEAFLAALIRFGSGGSDFSVSDLHAVAKVSALLLVLDGLDEVADINRREEVVKEVKLGIARLRSVASSVQVIITSRPAAFANSPGFPENEFPHFSLASLNMRLIETYSDKWLNAKGLHGIDAAAVKRILKAKLQQTHLRDLARNPMQLAILLSLIHTRGASLPDKRTALYDSYVNLFFDREAEKNATVRDYRDLLIDIHRYLGWTLHSDAEEGQHRGSITTDRLQVLLAEYLESEGRDCSLAEALFAGMVERVVFLISRLQGSFEFEVQPLREYFAARHLYETAPYSPPGSERTGTKPERFDALARNFYWLNVTRFYAGCYSKGEMSSLVDCLQELAADPEYRNTSLPQSLAAMLLSDWVFAQQPRAVREAVGILVSGLRLRRPMSHGALWRRGPERVVVLPNDCGRDELAAECASLLRDRLPGDYAEEIAELLRVNSKEEERKNAWIVDAVAAKLPDLPYWMDVGLHLGVLSAASDDELNKLISRDSCNPKLLDPLLQVGRTEYLSSPERCEAVVSGILNGEIRGPFQSRDRSILVDFAHVFDPFNYALGLIHAGPESMGEFLRRHTGVIIGEECLDSPAEGVLSECAKVVGIAMGELRKSTRDWRSHLTPWDTIVEAARPIWGEKWALCHMASFASSIRSQSETCNDFNQLLDSSMPLCRRARYARLRSGNPNWWGKQFDAAQSHLDIMFALLMLLAHASNRTVLALIQRIQPLFEVLADNEWNKLLWCADSQFAPVARSSSMQLRDFDVLRLPSGLSPKAVVVLGLRTRKEGAVALCERFLSDYHGSDQSVLEFCQRVAGELLTAYPSRFDDALRVFARNYRRGIYTVGIPAFGFLYSSFRPPRTRRLQLSLRPAARAIAAEPEKYPRQLVALADQICRDDIGSRMVPVGVVAQRQGWFSAEGDRGG